MEAGKYPFLKRSIFISLVTYILTIMFWHSLPLAVCLSSLPVIMGLTWRKGEAPIFSLALSFQWLQVSVAIIWRDIFGTYLMATDHPNTNLACYLGIINVIVLALGLRAGFSFIKDITPEDDSEMMQPPYSIKRIFFLYLIILLTSPFTLGLCIKYIQLMTILRTAIMMQHLFLFLLFFICIVYSRYQFAIIAVILEVIYGMTGFFSGYKSSLFIFIIASMTSMRAMTTKRKIMVSVVLALLFVLTMIWQGIKPELREAFYENRFKDIGISQEKTKFVYRLGEEFIKEEKGLQQEATLDSLVERVSSLYFFSCTLDMVPFCIPHEKGQLFLITVKHLLMPRLLFPNKPLLGSDSWMVRKYAGVWVAGEEEDTSIALGYVVEYYIDFGIPLMFLPTLILGIFTGVLYRYIFRIVDSPLFANALATSIFFFIFYQNEIANAKLWGGLISGYVLTIFFFLLIKKRLLRYLSIR